MEKRRASVFEEGEPSKKIKPTEPEKPICSTDLTRPSTRIPRKFFDSVHTRPKFVERSKAGTSGRTVSLSANYFAVLKAPSWSIYMYHVSFEPEVESTSERKNLFKVHHGKFRGLIFDGSTVLTSTKLEQERSEWETKREGSEDVFRITCTCVKTVTSSDDQAFRVLNLILRRAMAGLKLKVIGRNFFDAEAKVSLRECHLELWPGYITSIRHHENSIMLCTEITSKVMRLETALEAYIECMTNYNNGQDQFAKEIIGATVLTAYNNRTYRVDDIDWEATPMSAFKDRDDKPVRYVDYYAQKYGLRIQNLKQPLLISRSRQKSIRGGAAELVCLVPELCRLTGLTDRMRSDFRLMKAVADHTRIGPIQRIQRLNVFNERLFTTQRSMETLESWNLRLDRKLVQLQGRELLPEPIVFANKEVPGSNRADWTRDLRDGSMYTKGELRNWHVVTQERHAQAAQTFISVLQNSVRGLQIRIEHPQIVTMRSDRSDEFNGALESCVQQDSQLIMVVLQSSNAQHYAMVKKKCCVDRAIPSQVILLKTINPRNGNPRGLMSIATKVAIQMNCKLGAMPWYIRMPLTGLMVVGFDVSRDTKNRNVSHGALVATMDQKQSARFFTAVSSHLRDEELANAMGKNMARALLQFKREHGMLPSKIVFYRDGVSQGQVQKVVDSEVQELKRVLRSEYGDETVRFAFVIVTKRLNTRLFRDTTNPAPGTIVDSTITFPERYDFFLVPQHVNQGTVTPTSYNVVEDTLMLPPDKMQILTFKMCHLYFNWSGTIRVPAVCQYASRCAALVGSVLHQAPHDGLSNKLFYL